jgi:hypothetical protein
MSDNNGWSDQPGVPLNPEQDGAHRLRHSDSGLERDSLWLCGGTWVDSDGDFSISHAAAFYTYLGPCLTPAEVDARIQQAKRDALEEAAQEMDCACPQRGAVLAKLEKDGPLSHHWPCEKSDDCCALRGAAIRALSDTPPGMVLVPRDQQAETRAAKILAERNQLIGILQLAVEQSGDKDKEPAWLDAACRILNAGFTKAVKAGEGNV